MLSLDELNPQQRDAVTTLEGPLLVLAGAGTGKTRVITTRIANLLEHGVPPGGILAVTFTNKAAGEMRERVAGLVGKKQAKALTVGTFHAFCVRLLREHGAAIGIPERFTICDSADQAALHKGALRELSIPEGAVSPAALQAVVSLAKNRLQTPERFLEAAADEREELIGRAWRRYEDALRRARLLDFDDLLLRAVDLMRVEEVLRGLRSRYVRVLVDEFQDTNAPQFEVVRALCSEHRNLCAVGDDDQSIYGWRGADVTKILGFAKDFPEAKIVRLESNYRSTSNILEAANRVIANNADRHEKVLRPTVGPGEPVRFTRMPDEISEADAIVLEIVERVRRRQARFADHAILFRTAVQPRAFEGQLRARRVPYRLVGGTSFFDRKEIRDVVAYLRLVVNPLDEASFLRVVNRPPRGVGAASLERATDWATRHATSVVTAFERPEEVAAEIAPLPSAAVEAVAGMRRLLATHGSVEPGERLMPWLKELIDSVGYRGEIDRSYKEPSAREDRWKGAMMLLDMADAYVRRASGPTLAGFVEELTLSEQDDRKDDDVERDEVMLMTLHAAKGLEFPSVYLVGIEEGLLPHSRSVAEDGLGEERRLMYVGITRARQRLTVSYAEERTKYGHRAHSMPSRFLFEARGEPLPEGWVGAEAFAARAELERERREAEGSPAAGARGARKVPGSRKPKKTSRKKKTPGTRGVGKR